MIKNKAVSVVKRGKFHVRNEHKNKRR